MTISNESRTIQDREEALEEKLSALQIVPGYKAVVELFENGRKKRRSASAESWSPETGEIRIYFERSEAAGRAEVKPEKEVRPESIESPARAPASSSNPMRAALLEALQEAENTPGRMFVALKWFRDEYLPSTGLGWAQSHEERQAVLAKAIQDGWILTGKVPNPKAPSYPTTTIRLNRQKQPAGPSPSRFRPVPISGEPLSQTILQDRGAR